MLAGRITKLGTIELANVEEPELAPRDSSEAGAGGGEIIFQPRHACLCGSDLPYVYEAQPSYPLADGLSLHEMVGTVVATSGTRFRAGDRVLAVPVGQVGLFERFRLSEERAIPLDPRVPPEVALLAQPLGTVIYGLKKLPPILDLDVAVVGQGPIGQLFVSALRNLGAREIIALEPVASRLERSRAHGATVLIDPASRDAVEEVARATGGRMADVVIEAVGHADQALSLCVDLCREGGRILYFGVPTELLDRVPWRRLFFKNLTVHTTVNPDFRRDFPLAMRWIAERRIEVASLETHRFPLARIQEAFDTFHEKVGGALKVLIDFPSDWYTP
jgi:threonine dehydrogenase-like Zn-dependent dehydrogenase